jgi:hypothetical protein
MLPRRNVGPSTASLGSNGQRQIEENFERLAIEPSNWRMSWAQNLANRYDANFIAKNFFSGREIVPNRFASPRAVLLILFVLSSHLRFTSIARPGLAKGGFKKASSFRNASYLFYCSTKRALAPAAATELMRCDLAATNSARSTPASRSSYRGRDPFDRCRPVGLGLGRLVTTVCRCSPPARGHFHSPPGALMIDQT